MSLRFLGAAGDNQPDEAALLITAHDLLAALDEGRTRGGQTLGDEARA